MAPGFHIWGRVELIDGLYYVLVTSMPADHPGQRPQIEVRVRAIREEAETIMAKLMVELGEVVRARGGVVIDVVDEAESLPISEQAFWRKGS